MNIVAQDVILFFASTLQINSHLKVEQNLLQKNWVVFIAAAQPIGLFQRSF